MEGSKTSALFDLTPSEINIRVTPGRKVSTTKDSIGPRSNGTKGYSGRKSSRLGHTVVSREPVEQSVTKNLNRQFDEAVSPEVDLERFGIGETEEIPSHVLSMTKMKEHFRASRKAVSGLARELDTFGTECLAMFEGEVKKEETRRLQLEKELKNSMEIARLARQENERMVRDSKAHVEKIGSLEGSLASIRREMDDLRRSHRDQTSRNDQKISSLTQELSMMKEEKQSIIVERESLALRIMDYRQKYEEAGRQTEQKIEKLKELEREKAKAEEKCLHLDTTVEGLKADLRNMQAMAKEEEKKWVQDCEDAKSAIDGLKGQLNAANSTIAENEDQLEYYRDELDRMKMDQETDKRERDTYKSIATDAEARIEDLSEKLKAKERELSESLDKYQRKCEEEEKDRKKAADDLAASQKRTALLELRLREYENQIIELERTLDKEKAAMDLALAEHDQCGAKVESLEHSLQSKTKEVAGLERERSILARDLSVSENAVSSLRTSLSQAQKMILDLQKEKEDLQSSYDGMQIEKEMAEQDIDDRIENSMKNLEEELANSRKETLLLIDETAKLREQCDTLSRTSTAQVEELSVKKKAVKELENKVLELETQVGTDGEEMRKLRDQSTRQSDIIREDRRKLVYPVANALGLVNESSPEWSSPSQGYNKWIRKILHRIEEILASEAEAKDDYRVEVERVEKLKDEMETMRTRLMELETTCKNNRDEANAAQAEMEKVQEDYEKLEGEYSDKVSEIRRMEEVLDRKEREMNVLRETTQHLQEKVTALASAKDHEYEESPLVLPGKISSVLSRRTRGRSSVAEFQTNERDALNDEVLKLREHLERYLEIEDYAKVIERLEEDKSALEEELSNSQHREQSAMDELATLEKDVETLKDMVSQKEEKIESLRAGFGETLAEKNASLEKVQSQLRHLIIEKDNHLSRLERELEEKSREVERLSERVRSEEETSDELKRQITHLELSLETLQADMRPHEEKYNALKRELGLAEDTRKMRESSIETLKEAISGLEDNLEKERKRVHELTSELESYASVKRELKEAQARVQKSEQQARTVSFDLELAQSEVARLQSDLKFQNNDRNKSEAERVISSLRSQLCEAERKALVAKQHAEDVSRSSLAHVNRVELKQKLLHTEGTKVESTLRSVPELRALCEIILPSSPMLLSNLPCTPSMTPRRRHDIRSSRS